MGSIELGDISLTVFQLPNETYCLSQSEVSAVINKPARSIFAFLRSKQLKSLAGEDFKFSHSTLKLSVEGSQKPITPVSVEMALLYWHKWAQQGNPLALALVLALAKRSIYEAADQALGVARSCTEHDLLLAEDLSDAGVARIEAMRQSLNQQLPDSHSESLTERELKLKIQLLQLELERVRLQQCACNNGLAVKDVNKIGTVSWEVVNWVRDAIDSPSELAAVQEIKRLGYGFDNECWLQVKLIDSFWVLPWRAFHSLTDKVKRLPHKPNQ